MANRDQLRILREEGVDAWNDWRKANPKTKVNFSEALLIEENLQGINLRNADLSWADALGADFSDADLTNADLTGIDARDSLFNAAKLQRANLSGACLNDTHFINANLRGCRVHGITAWNINLEGANQNSLIITSEDDPAKVTVDNIELAHFMYLLLRNEKLRDVIDTLTTKVTLILGRFSEERMWVLKKIKEHLRKAGYVPVLFDFHGPNNKSILETVATLARMSKCVVVDITDPKVVYSELMDIVPNLPTVPVFPIMHINQDFPDSMHYFTRFPWFKRVQRYDLKDDNNLEALARAIVNFIKYSRG